MELRTPIIAANILKTGGTPPFGEGIDVPQNFIAPSSRHICGGFYEWDVDRHPREVPLADPPDWLSNVIVALRTAAI